MCILLILEPLLHHFYTSISLCRRRGIGILTFSAIGTSSGSALALHWRCSGSALARLWRCSGSARALLWLCSGSASGAAVSSGAGDYAEAAAPTDSEWATYYDDSGYPYYFNAATGESTYDPPPGF